MKKLVYAFLPTLLLMVACEGSKSSGENAEGEKSMTTEDSLRAAIAERDSLLLFISEVDAGMEQLLDLQADIDNSAQLSAESPTRKANFSEQVNRINYQMTQNKQRLERLEKQLKESKGANAALLNSITALKRQIANQETLIASLTNQLNEAGVKIAQQEEQIDSLNTTVTDITSQRDMAQERSEQLTTELNKCYYVYATKNELKKANIIETGFLRKTKILPDDFEQQFFQTADKTKLTTINTHSSKAKVLTAQPANSYAIEDVNGQKVIKITNPVRFWEKSNYLVIQVD